MHAHSLAPEDTVVRSQYSDLVAIANATEAVARLADVWVMNIPATEAAQSTAS